MYSAGRCYSNGRGGAFHSSTAIPKIRVYDNFDLDYIKISDRGLIFETEGTVVLPRSQKLFGSFSVQKL